MRATAMIALALLSACADTEGAVVDFRIVHAPSDTPYAGADTIRITLERADRAALFELTAPVSAVEGEVPLVPDGEGYRFRVEALASPIVFARGRSFPFSIEGGQAPSRRPDVLLGTLGTFVAPAGDATPGRVVAVAPAEGGAILVTEDGGLLRYRAHTHDDAHDGEASVETVARVAERAGARWAPLAGGLVLGVGGASPGASVHDASGAMLASTEADALSAQHHGAAIATLPDAPSALVLGGAAGPLDAPTAQVTRIDVEPREDGTLGIRVSAVQPLSTARRSATAVAVPVHDPDAECPCARVVVIGGTDGVREIRTAELVDPAGGDAPVTLEVDGALDGAAAIAVDTGLVLLAGGRSADGVPVPWTRALDVQPRALRVISPEPPALLVPRSDAVAVRFDAGLVLIAGGRGPDGAPLASAEIYDFEIARFGEAASTSALPVPDGRPRGATLADGTVLIAGDVGPHVYFPPRGGGP